MASRSLPLNLERALLCWRCCAILAEGSACDSSRILRLAKQLLGVVEHSNATEEHLSLKVDDECPVCLQHNPVIILLRCGHQTCSLCHQRIIAGPTSTRRCPLCREQLDFGSSVSEACSFSSVALISAALPVLLAVAEKDAAAAGEAQTLICQLACNWDAGLHVPNSPGPHGQLPPQVSARGVRLLARLAQHGLPEAALALVAFIRSVSKTGISSESPGVDELSRELADCCFMGSHLQICYQSAHLLMQATATPAVAIALLQSRGLGWLSYMIVHAALPATASDLDLTSACGALLQNLSSEPVLPTVVEEHLCVEMLRFASLGSAPLACVAMNALMAVGRSRSLAWIARSNEFEELCSALDDMECEDHKADAVELLKLFEAKPANSPASELSRFESSRSLRLDDDGTGAQDSLRANAASFLTCRTLSGIKSTQHGEWYWEASCDLPQHAHVRIGWIRSDCRSHVDSMGGLGSDQWSWGFQEHDGRAYHNGVHKPYGAKYVSKDVIGSLLRITLDCVEMFWFVNGSCQGCFWQAALSDCPPAFFPAFSLYGGGGAVRCVFRAEDSVSTRSLVGFSSVDWIGSETSIANVVLACDALPHDAPACEDTKCEVAATQPETITQAARLPPPFQPWRAEHRYLAEHADPLPVDTERNHRLHNASEHHGTPTEKSSLAWRAEHRSAAQPEHVDAPNSAAVRMPSWRAEHRVTAQREGTDHTKSMLVSPNLELPPGELSDTEVACESLSDSDAVDDMVNELGLSDSKVQSLLEGMLRDLGPEPSREQIELYLLRATCADVARRPSSDIDQCSDTYGDDELAFLPLDVEYWENLETEERRRERSALDQLEENVQSDLASHLEISQLENEIRSMEDLLKLHDRCDSGSAASPEMGEPTTEAILAERALVSALGLYACVLSGHARFFLV